MLRLGPLGATPEGRRKKSAGDLGGDPPRKCWEHAMSRIYALEGELQGYREAAQRRRRNATVRQRRWGQNQG